MPPHLERTALILLAGTALTACASPRYPVTAPLVQLPPPAAAPPAPAPAQMAAAREEPPAAVVRSAPVETAQLAPLSPAAPAPAGPAVAQPPVLAFAPPAVDTAARARSRRGPAATYTVKKGDTLAGIADKLGTDVRTLAKANGLKSPYRINPGDVLKNPKAPATSAKKPATSRAEGGQTYTVQAGDTLFGIATRFGTTVDALREANGISGSGLMRGRTLKIPGDAAEAPVEADEPEAPPARTSSARPDPAPQPAAEEAPSADGRTITTRQVTGRVVDIQVPGAAYKVKSGDNLERIARRLDSDIDELAKLNKLKKPYRLQPGQTIRGPGSSAKGYVVGRGDTLALIARRFDVTVDELRAANGLRRGASVAPGRRLKLPAGYRDRGPIVTRSEAPAAAPPRAPTTPAPRPPSSFDNQTPPGQRLPPPISAPRPPQVEDTTRLPSQPQPYRPSGPVAGAPVASPPVSDAQIMEMGRGRFAWPIRGELISTYGARGMGQRNDGVNIRAAAGEPVRASAAGDVVYAGDQVPGFGNLVLIKHADGWVTAYGHLGRVNVRMQQKVEQGQEIGQAGSSGGVSEPQLHFEVRYAPTPQERARPIDPALVLPR